MGYSDQQALRFLRGHKQRRLLQRHALTSSAVQFGIDLVLSLAVLYGLAVLKMGSFPDVYLRLGTVTALLMWVIYREQGIYSFHKGLFSTIYSLLKSWLYVFIALVIIGFVTKSSAIFSRQVIVSWFFLGAVVQVATHIITRRVMPYLRSREAIENALVVGASDVGRYLAERINNNPWLSSHIIGVVDDDQKAMAKWQVTGVPKLGDITHLPTAIKEYNIKALYIALPVNEMGMLQKIYIDSIEKNISVYWTPPIFDMTLVNHNIKQIGNVPVLSLAESPLNGQRAITKKLFDYSISLIALILLSPVMIATAMAIKLTSPGPILFKQKRHGWQGEVFEVWKFRSMHIHQECDGEIKQATKDDPRITKVGCFIRRTSIDELPQLFNVLNGTMSLVGPRPHAVEHNIFYSPKINAYMARHKIKPGLTGLAQINGCRGETKTIDEMQRRVEYDLEYINNWSNALDVKILFKTVLVLFSDKAY